MSALTIVPSLLAVAIAALISALITWISRPLLQRYALARPNARSSHTIPTPQGAGIAVISATLVVALGWGVWANVAIPPALFIATILIALVGFADDLISLPVLVRLVLQAACVGAVVFTAPDEARVVPALPLALERGLIVIAGIWFVNLVNFMDGLDWMTVAEMVPVTGALVLLGLAGTLPPLPSLAAAALLGGLLGFAPFNRPVARLFLGDVGSLPIGLIVAWLLYRLALEGGLAAAVLLPMFYLADASLTLLRRLARRERVWEAHRTHFYQRATVNGLSVRGVVARVFAVNVALALLAAATLLWPGWPVTLPAMAAGIGLVAALLARFARPSRRLVEG